MEENLVVDLKEKYGLEKLNELKEGGAAISRDMAQIELKPDNETNLLLKETIKKINIEPKKGLLGKFKNKAQGKFIDVADTNRVIQMFETKVGENLKGAQMTLRDIESGITRSEQHLETLEMSIKSAEEDIPKYEKYMLENNLMGNFEAGQVLEFLKEAHISLVNDKASFQNTLMQYQLQKAMQYKIIMNASNTKTSVTNKLRASVTQANILAKQKEFIENNKEIQDMMKGIELQTANGINDMITNNSQLSNHQDMASHSRQLFNTNVQSLTTLKELNKEMDASRQILLTSLQEDEEVFNKEYATINQAEKVLESGDVNKMKELTDTFNVEQNQDK